MKNFVVPGRSIPYTNNTGSNIQPGDVVPIGNSIGISMGLIVIGDTQTVELWGAYELPIDNTGAHGTAVTAIVGTPLWWDAAHDMCVSANTGGTLPLAGVIFRTEQASATSATILLCPFANAAGDAITTQAAIPTITTANATDLASAEALSNQNKTTINAILAALRSAGVILP